MMNKPEKMIQQAKNQDINFTHGLLPDCWQLGAIPSYLGDSDRVDTCADLDGIFSLGISSVDEG